MSSSKLFISYLSGPGFYLAFRNVTTEIGFLVPFPNVQLLLVIDDGI